MEACKYVRNYFTTLKNDFSAIPSQEECVKSEDLQDRHFKIASVALRFIGAISTAFTLPLTVKVVSYLIRGCVLGSFFSLASLTVVGLLAHDAIKMGNNLKFLHKADSIRGRVVSAYHSAKNIINTTSSPWDWFQHGVREHKVILQGTLVAPIIYRQLKDNSAQQEV